MGHDRPVQGGGHKARLSVCSLVMEHPWEGCEGSGGKGAQVWFYKQVLGFFILQMTYGLHPEPLWPRLE